MSDQTDRLRELAGKAHEREIANILRKLNEGDTLTAAQRGVLEAYRSEESKPEGLLSDKTNVPVTTLASLFNLTDARISQLANEKIIAKTDRGKYRLWESIRGYIRFLQSAGKGGDSYHENRARLERAKADRAEIELAARRGELVDLHEIKHEYMERVVICRQKMLGIPHRASHDLAGMTDSIKIQNVLDEEIKDALHELTKEVSGPPVEIENTEPTPAAKKRPGRPRKI